MITVSTKRLYSLGKIEASPKRLAITSNLSSGKEVGVTGGVVRGGFLLRKQDIYVMTPPPL